MSSVNGVGTIRYLLSNGSLGTPAVKSRARSEIERKPFGSSGMPVSPACAMPLKL